MNQSTFKRIDVGTNFVSNQNGTSGKRFRKVNEKVAVALLPNGRGQTHAKIPFSRSHAVSV